MIMLQSLFALATIGCLVRLVFPRLREEEGAETVELALTGDVWIPLALCLPLILLAPVGGASVAGIGWASSGAPIMVGWMVAAAAMATVDRGGGLVRGGDALLSRASFLVLWALGGVMLLLLGAAHELTLLTGQIMFALGAVLLWLLSAAPGASGVGGEGRSAVRAALGLLGALVCSAACAAFGVRAASFGAVQPALIVACAPGMFVAAPLALYAGRGRTIRIGGFTALIGLWLGLGALSLSRLLPRAMAVRGDGAEAVGTGVAVGFGRYAFEGVLLLLLVGVALLSGRVPRPVRLACAACMALVGLVLVLVRIRAAGG